MALPPQRRQQLGEELREEAMRVADKLIKKANDRNERLSAIGAEVDTLADIADFARKLSL